MTGCQQLQEERPVAVTHALTQDGRVRHYFVMKNGVFRCACGEVRNTYGMVLR